MIRYARHARVFLSLLLLTAFITPLAAQNDELLILKEPCTLYSEASLAAQALCQLSTGETLIVLSRDGDWLRVMQGERSGYILRTPDMLPQTKGLISPSKDEQKDRFFLMGLGMLRINWAKVQGDAIRFRYSDLGLPADFSTRERASFTFDGTFEQGLTRMDGYLNYDPENRINEPPLDFLFNARRGVLRLSVGDYRMGVMADSIFSRYYHPFRGAILGLETPSFHLQTLGGVARGESTVDQFLADLGTGPYYLSDSPVLRGSEMIFLVTRSRRDQQTELQRLVLQRNRDYHLDYDRGVIMLTFFLAPTDEQGNPRFIEAAYQFESLAGRFTRAVFGARARWQPWTPLGFTVSYIGDADQALPLDRIALEHKGILSFGVNLATRPLDIQAELAYGLDPNGETEQAFFLGAQLRPMSNVQLMVNSWNLDSQFPAFANRQLEYGYSLMQINPTLSNRSVFLSPFQFTRNLGSELYPFSLSRLAVDERETHGVLEWERGIDRLSIGYGQGERNGGSLEYRDIYLSGLHHGEQSTAWFKSGGSWDDRPAEVGSDRQLDLLGGWRQRIKRLGKGDLFVQVDMAADWQDQAGIDEQIHRQVFSLAGEYLSGQNGLFAGLRHERLHNPQSKRDSSLWSTELGIKHPLHWGLFVDSRYRQERSEEEAGDRQLDYLSLGLGYEHSRFRALARYEIQANRLGVGENRRRVWSMFMFGSPLRNMSLSVQYHK